MLTHTYTYTYTAAVPPASNRSLQPRQTSSKPPTTSRHSRAQSRARNRSSQRPRSIHVRARSASSSSRRMSASTCWVLRRLRPALVVVWRASCSVSAREARLVRSEVVLVERVYRAGEILVEG